MESCLIFGVLLFRDLCRRTFRLLSSFLSVPFFFLFLSVFSPRHFRQYSCSLFDSRPALDTILEIMKKEGTHEKHSYLIEDCYTALISTTLSVRVSDTHAPVQE